MNDYAVTIKMGTRNRSLDSAKSSVGKVVERAVRLGFEVSEIRVSGADGKHIGDLDGLRMEHPAGAR